MFSISRHYSFATTLLAVASMQSALHLQVSAAEEVTRIGGVRNVVVAISSSGDDYHIVVEMLAVRVFDSATNKKLNLQKARTFAMHALAKHLARGGVTRFTVRSVQVQDASTTNGSYRVTLLVRRGDIVLDRRKPAKKSADVTEPVRTARKTVVAKEGPFTPKDEQWLVDEDSSAAVLLTRMADYLDTLKWLREGVLEELGTAQDKVRQQDEFYTEIAELEERLDVVSDSMFAEIDADKLLLTLEQQELREAVKRQRTEVFKALKAAVEQFDAQQETMKKESIR